MNKRPTPEKLLAQLKAEKLHHGKLKIYIGAAPGVGKTYSMLQDALVQREQGLDVVAGIVESHGRKEIDNMLASFEILPRKIVDYHDKSLLEFDLDAALTRMPALILIDEMAHTNVIGLRHAKRWQDIKELIDRGIDVYTTLNVQHIESLNDIISQITGIRVRETVPDSMLEMAHTIELVDLPPDDLLKRLQEGKVYIPAQAELATQHFFRKGNLTALRELALRFTAERVDQQMLSHRRGHGIDTTWPTVERILVCIGADTGAAKIIRSARRLAMNLHANWIVVHVETPRLNLSDKQKKIAIQNLRLAEQLGAETRIIMGVDIAKEIVNFAKEYNVTKLVVGKQIRPRWQLFFKKTLVDEILREAKDIDVYIVRSSPDQAKTKLEIEKLPTPWKSYLFAGIVLGIFTGVNFLIQDFVTPNNVVMIYMLGIVIIAMRGQIGPAFFATLGSAILYVMFFGSQQLSFSLTDIHFIFTFLIMLLIAQVISHLSLLNKQQAEVAHIGEQRTVALHGLSRQLASTRGIGKLLEIAVHYLSEVFDCEVIALLYENNELTIHAGSTPKKTLNPKDQAVAQWVYDLGQIAGLGTDTLPFSDSIYVPLLGSSGSVGVLKVRPRQMDRLLIPEQFHLLEACAHQIALAIEVDRLQEGARQTQITIETERLRTALFSSLSHELQYPLAVIVRLINKLIKKKATLDEEAIKQLTESIYSEAERLNRLINNLLQITQLEEGEIVLHKSMHNMKEVVETALMRLEKKLNNKEVKLQIPDSLPLIPFDKVLMEQVLVNLIENAILYTPLDTPIEIAATAEDNDILISIADKGMGLSMEDVEKVFEKFYRGKIPKKSSGSGLGLSVCQSIIKAHGGKIWAENRWDGGAVFYFVLPLHDVEAVDYPVEGKGN